MKKLKSGLVIGILLLLMLPGLKISAEADRSGTFGKFAWTLEDGTLTISGEGILPNYYPAAGKENWQAYNEEITELILEEGITGTGFMSFSDCTALETVTLPESLTVLGQYSFRNCTALESIAIPEKVIMVEPDAFEGCESLEDINVADENPVYASEDGILYNKAVTELVLFPEGKVADPYTVPDEMTRIGAGMFSGCTGIKSLIIPDHVTGIGANAFSNCTSLERVSMADSVTSMGWGAFYGCTALKGLEISAGLEEISARAFQNCISLESVKVPEGIQKIGNHAFAGCTSLQTVYLPETVSEIIFSFYDCGSLEGFAVSRKNETFSQKDGVLFCDDGKTLFSYPAAYSDSYDIPEGTEAIHTGAFTYVKDLKKVSFPSTLKTIGAYAFQYCFGLTEVEIPEGVISLGGDEDEPEAGSEACTFLYCTGLRRVTLPDTLTEIPRKAFYGCSSLEYLVLPEGVAIGAEAFGNCKELDFLVIPSEPGTIAPDAFEGTVIADVYYYGTEEEVKTIPIEDTLPELIQGFFGEAEWHYNDEEVLLKDPFDVTVMEGEKAVFRVEAFGEDLDCQWYLSTDEGKTWSKISDGKTSVYALTADLSQNGYWYKCVVKGETVQMTSETARLTVNPKPSIMIQPADVKIPIDGKAMFLVIAPESDLEYQWYYRNDADDVWKKSIRSSGKTEAFSFTAQETSSGHQYKCRIFNMFGYQDSDTVTLTVIPKLLEQPASLSVTEGSPAEFTLTAEGTNLRYQWFYREDSVGAWKAIPSPEGNTESLSFTAQMLNRGFQYKCEVTSNYGTAISNTAVLMVIPEPPVILEQPSDVSVPA